MNTLNVEQAMSQLARLGGPALIGDVLAAFRRQVPGRISEALAACAEHDPARLARSAHALRSSCGQLGAAGLAERCRRLEVLGDAGTVEGARPVVLQLKADIDDLIGQLERRCQPAPGPGQRRRVVGIVEDNDDTRLILRKMLEPFYEVDECPDGAAALDRFRVRPPDVILLDISLPGLDGPAVLMELRRIPALAVTPVIALTAHAMVGDREWYLAKGFDEYISKPILDERDLLKLLESVLERRHDG